MSYVRRASPLHAARPGVALAWCAALAVCVLVVDHPVVLALLLAVVVAAGAGARVLDRLGSAARFGLPLALLIAAVNPLIVREGLTVIARVGEVPPFGQVDITLEATAYGTVLGLRALVLILVFGLYSAAVDPDAVLRLFRRRGLRSAMTVTVATRMVPVLARDAQRLADGQRCLAAGPAPRGAVVRAVSSGALDRALDVAAALELRGYGLPARRTRGRGGPWSRHDAAFAGSALVLAVLTVAGALAGLDAFSAYPRLDSAPAGGAAALGAALGAAALAPFADRRGVGA